MFAASKRAPVVRRVAPARGRHQLRVLGVHQLLVTRIHGVDERVGHVELGQAVHCQRHVEFKQYNSTHDVKRLAGTTPATIVIIIIIIKSHVDGDGRRVAPSR